MIKISRATKKETLDREWRLFATAHYGKGARWKEENFRFKAVEDGKLVGTIDGKLEGDVVYIASLMTIESARGKGIGTKLIQKAEEYGKHHGARKSWLLTGTDWPANTYYKKLGFELAGKIPDLYFHKDFFVYTRPIE